MIRIGITGGIGSGKSTVCAFLKKKGAVVFNADEVASRIMIESASVRREIIDFLGPGAYQKDGTLDRDFVAMRIFNDSDARRKIGEIVHPRVHEQYIQMVLDAEKMGAVAIIREAAVLPDVSARSDFDVIIAVESPAEIRIDRVNERDHLSAQQIKMRMDAQPSEEAYRMASEKRIINEGSLEDLKRSVDEVWTHILQHQND